MLPRQWTLAAGLMLLGVTIRVLPYVLHVMGLVNVFDPEGMPWNIAPIGATCLFGGAVLADRRLAFFVPLASMLLSDLAIGALMGDIAFGLHPMIPISYGSFALMVWAGTWLRSERPSLQSPWRRGLAIAAVGLIGELMFFLVTNFANWALQDYMPIDMPRLYAMTFDGLVQCYVQALPFFRKSLVGMAVYGTALFAGYELLLKGAPAPQTAPLAEAASGGR